MSEPNGGLGDSSPGRRKSSSSKWGQGGPHQRGFSAPVHELLQEGGGRGSLRFSASPVEVGGSLVRDVQLGTPTSAPAHPNHMDEVAIMAAGLARQQQDGLNMPPPPKRVHSVATFKALHAMADNIEPMSKSQSASEFHGGGLDSAAEGQRVQNAWWRTWSLHNRKNSSLKDVTFAHSDSPGDTLRISSDALSVEGMDKSHRPKIWEEFYNIFLDRLATNDGANFIAELADHKGSSRSSRHSGAMGDVGGGSGPVPIGGAGLGGAMEQGHDGPGLMIDESVHGANLFAAMFRSDPNASLPAPSSSSEDFSHFTLPWDPRPSSSPHGHGSGLPWDPHPSSSPPSHDSGISPPMSPPNPMGAVGFLHGASGGLGPSGGGGSKPLQIPKADPGANRQMQDEEEHSVVGSLRLPLGLPPPGRPPRAPDHPQAMETILKKAFTAVHNSHKFGHDNASAYLGDDLSVHQNSIFGGQVFGSLSTSLSSSGSSSSLHGLRMRHSPNSSLGQSMSGMLMPSRSRSDMMKDVEGTVPSKTSTRSPILQRICSCSQWKRSEQHWLLPAVMAMCNEEASLSSPPPSSASPSRSTEGLLLSQALSCYGDLEASSGADLSLTVDPEAQAHPPPPFHYDPFQTYVMGEVMVCSAVLLGHADFRPLPAKWEPRLLAIKQNFLLEYLPGEPKRPIGFVHLQGCTASARLDAKNVLHLLTTSDLTAPSTSSQAHSSSMQHTLLLQARSPGQAARWASQLEQAGSVRTEDLFEYVPVKPNATHPGAADLTGTAALKAAELGRGRFAVVRKARRRKYGEASRRVGSSNEGDDTVCALKVVNKHAFWTRVADGKERHDTLVREILGQGILTAQGQQGAMGVDCPIVRLFSVFETTESVVLELELMSRNDLFDELSTAGVLKEHKTAAIVYQVVLAVNFCREHKIAHRDVKLSNIIFPLGAQDQQAPPTVAPPLPFHSQCKVKLADFGMAGFFGKDGTLRGRCGTPGYVAPEILCAGVNEGYGNNVDIFSVGVVAYTLLCGYEPFYGVTDKQLIAANKLAEYEFHEPEWTRISHEAKDLVSKMLLRDPEKRITPSAALEHPWLRAVALQLQQQLQPSTMPGQPYGAAMGKDRGPSPVSGSMGGSSAEERSSEKCMRLSSPLRAKYASPPCLIM